ncbi:GntR family transcriptional regulator, histidine utilization repressor [Microbulbifer thermotolerans]|uniref:histidine utilization repressor n=1 Tax=Microbulbifer thermotolerans TaxID=252514 RepID=UPI0008E78D87|nr:histidine utilization repressor [Microbulbifer thermotolerans]WKT60287.1 histidine utilization repressor [Microbulbifer thermotolerans]SFD10734.1 GntR family transcriptional regulator, histidine utilization repressor [Microbulbifer thermotolerans]
MNTAREPSGPNTGEPRYAAIKRHIRRQIETGNWPVHFQVPSENQLAQEFNVSRMTARRALSELTDEGVLKRSQGLGTFVAEPVPAGSLLEVRNIADEISARGHSYSSRVLLLQGGEATPEVAHALNVPEGALIFHSIIVHCDNGLPIQWEERFTNPALAPDYLQQDFSATTPNAYLSRVAPLVEADTTVEAIAADAAISAALAIEVNSPCLQIWRRTKSSAGTVSFARLVHPGNRYRLGAQLRF